MFRLLVLMIALALAGLCSGAVRSSSSSRSSSYSRSSRSYSGSYRSGSSRYGSSRGTGYGSLSLLVSSRFSYRVNRLSYSRGIFFATWSWRSRHSEYSDSSAICFNVVDSLPAEYNSSVVQPWLYKSQQVYGLFVCPIDQARPDRIYCCGTEEAQSCCSFLEDSGKVVGLFVGLSIGLLVSAFIAFHVRRFYIRRQKLARSRQQASNAVIVAHIVPATADESSIATVVSSSLTPGQSAASGGAESMSNKPSEHLGEFDYAFGQQQLPPLPAYQELVTQPAELPPAYWEVNSRGQPGQMPTVHH